MNNRPADLKYTASHEWVRIEGDIAVVGLTDHAAAMLGDLVFIEMPPVGDAVTQGDDIIVVESVKTASDVYAPLSGKIVAVNETLLDAPEILNNDQYQAGWLVKISFSDAAEIDQLLDLASYEKMVAVNPGPPHEDQ